MKYLKNKKFKLLSITLLSFFVITGCRPGEDPQYLTVDTASKDAPRVNWDITERPIPNIPIPNNIALRSDATSATGLRVNVTEEADTNFEREIREGLNELDGFSTFAPMWASFDKALDYMNIRNRHSDYYNFEDDVVLVVNLNPASKNYLEFVALDLGQGAYPIGVKDTNSYFLNDVEGQNPGILFNMRDEDTNKNGVLDLGEDLDSDKVLDKPNRMNIFTNPFDDMMTFYESETNSLLFRPLVPLEENSLYGVIITKNLRGAMNGNKPGPSVGSPFPGTSHPSQTKDLIPAIQALSKIGMSSKDIAFAWTFKTQTLFTYYEDIKEAFRGRGPLKYIRDQIKRDFTLIKPLDEPEDILFKDEKAFKGSKGNEYLLPGEKMVSIFDQFSKNPVFKDLLDSEQGRALVNGFKNIHYLSGGYLDVPLMMDEGKESFSYLELLKGKKKIRTEKATFTLSIPEIPKGTNIKNQQPFPLVILAHGYTSASRYDQMVFMGEMAKYGFATISMDQFKHGFEIAESSKKVLKFIFKILKLNKDMEDYFFSSRVPDLNGDGVIDSGGGFFSGDLRIARDSLRQSITDYLYLIEFIEYHLTEKPGVIDYNGDGKLDPLFDYNMDGVMDIQMPEYMCGMSLGAIMTMTVGNISENLKYLAPISGGAGLSDIFNRSNVGGLRESAHMSAMGLIMVGATDRDPVNPKMEIYFNVADVLDQSVVLAAKSQTAAPGDIIEVKNMKTGKSEKTPIGKYLQWRVSIATDKGDPLEISIYDKDTGELKERINQFGNEVGFTNKNFDWKPEDLNYKIVNPIKENFRGKETTYLNEKILANTPLVSPINGLGLKRATPKLRKIISIAQNLVDTADPVNFMPLASSNRFGKKNVLNILTLGDNAVPISTGIAAGRALGAIDYQIPKAKLGGLTEMEFLIKNHVVEGLANQYRFGKDETISPLYDPDDPDNGRDGLNTNERPLTEQDRLLLSVKKDGHTLNQRFAYANRGGSHSFSISDPSKKFDVYGYYVNMIAKFFYDKGTKVTDNDCLEKLNQCYTGIVRPEKDEEGNFTKEALEKREQLITSCQDIFAKCEYSDEINPFIEGLSSPKDSAAEKTAP